MSQTQAQFETNLQAKLDAAGYEGISKADTREILGIVTTEIGSALKSDGGVRVRGIGTFTAKEVAATKARKGINPFTKEEQMFKAKPASTKVIIRAGKDLKEAAAKK